MTKIAFFSEAQFKGKVPRNHPNSRTDVAWQITLQSDHYCVHDLPSRSALKYDLGIVIIPKKNPVVDLDTIKGICGKVCVMQEGPNWFWQDYDVRTQIHFYNILQSVDFLLCHNEIDRKYYSGLTYKPVHILQSLMIEDTIQKSEIGKEAVIVGGNLVSWYGGMDSYIVASQFGSPVHAPTMGRKQEEEEHLFDMLLPYMPWSHWMNELSSYKYAVHLMRTYAAGTFFLNTSYFGIPTIGYNSSDTARILHPLTTVDEGDLEKAQLMVEKLQDEKFYNLCSETTKKRYKQYYTEEVWLHRWEEIMKAEGLV